MADTGASWENKLKEQDNNNQKVLSPKSSSSSLKFLYEKKSSSSSKEVSKSTNEIKWQMMNTMAENAVKGKSAEQHSDNTPITSPYTSSNISSIYSSKFTDTPLTSPETTKEIKISPKKMAEQSTEVDKMQSQQSDTSESLKYKNYENLQEENERLKAKLSLSEAQKTLYDAHSSMAAAQMSLQAGELSSYQAVQAKQSQSFNIDSWQTEEEKAQGYHIKAEGAKNDIMQCRKKVSEDQSKAQAGSKTSDKEISDVWKQAENTWEQVENTYTQASKLWEDAQTQWSETEKAWKSALSIDTWTYSSPTDDGKSSKSKFSFKTWKSSSTYDQNLKILDQIREEQENTFEGRMKKFRKKIQPKFMKKKQPMPPLSEETDTNRTSGTSGEQQAKDSNPQPPVDQNSNVSPQQQEIQKEQQSEWNDLSGKMTKEEELQFFEDFSKKQAQVLKNENQSTSKQDKTYLGKLGVRQADQFMEERPQRRAGMLQGESGR